MITTIIIGVVALVGGFVFGVLFGRRNTQKVERAVAEANAAIARVEKAVENLKKG